MLVDALKQFFEKTDREIYFTTILQVGAFHSSVLTVGGCSPGSHIGNSLSWIENDCVIGENDQFKFSLIPVSTETWKSVTRLEFTQGSKGYKPVQPLV